MTLTMPSNRSLIIEGESGSIGGVDSRGRNSSRTALYRRPLRRASPRTTCLNSLSCVTFTASQPAWRRSGPQQPDRQTGSDGTRVLTQSEDLLPFAGPDVLGDPGGLAQDRRRRQYATCGARHEQTSG